MWDAIACRTDIDSFCGSWGANPGDLNIVTYGITYIRDKASDEDGTFTGSFHGIRAEAQEAVRAGECDRVQVRDPDGAIRYQYPGAASRAQ